MALEDLSFLFSQMCNRQPTLDPMMTRFVTTLEQVFNCLHALEDMLGEIYKNSIYEKSDIATAVFQKQQRSLEFVQVKIHEQMIGIEDSPIRMNIKIIKDSTNDP